MDAAGNTQLIDDTEARNVSGYGVNVVQRVAVLVSSA